ncbi:MAG: hypothetical protein R3275_13050 [Saprospiraceae bacterium]|nr:hypothetical protein [Saprospiraceae bacterium]
MIRTIITSICILTLLSCTSDDYSKPKPRAYPRIDFPERSIDTFRSEDCPFTFQFMSYGKVEKRTEYFDREPLHPCWFDIVLPDLDGRIHFSYVPVNSTEHFDKLVADAFKLSSKHNVKANYIDEMTFKNENDVSGMVFDLQGPVASPFQFYATDSTDHFLRASLYLNTKVRPDSLAPIYAFLKEDITLILNSLEWKTGDPEK